MSPPNSEREAYRAAGKILDNYCGFSLTKERSYFVFIDLFDFVFTIVMLILITNF